MAYLSLAPKNLYNVISESSLLLMNYIQGKMFQFL